MSTLIPSMSDKKAVAANNAAIDQADCKDFRHIVAWCKLLGITAGTCVEMVQAAEEESAPVNSIQKIDGRWLTVDDITNATTRQIVNELAK